MSYQEFLSFERRGAVGIVRLARPEKLNTISAPFYEAMIELQQAEIVGDHDLRAIALLADGRHFSAGIDLNYAKAVIGKPGRSLYGVYHWQQAYRFWSECNLPVVVGIQGACMGTAIELITACDIRIAADNAKFSLREVDVGISTDLGGTTRLTKLIGPGMTKLLAMTCEDIDAQEAARIRLVERVVPLGELEQTTLAYAEKLAAKPQVQLLQQPVIRETLIYIAVAQMVILFIQPILSLYVAELSHGDGNIMFLSGVAFSLVGVASAITAPSWGRFGQAHGFYKALCAAALLSSIMNVVAALPRTLLLFCVCNFGYGLCCAGIQPSLSAILASNTTTDQRGRVFGFMFSAQQFGSMVGPVLGGAIATFAPLQSLFVVAGVILFGISACVWLRHGHEQNIVA